MGYHCKVACEKTPCILRPAFAFNKLTHSYFFRYFLSRNKTRNRSISVQRRAAVGEMTKRRMAHL